MSTFDEILAQVIDLLQREGRVAYRVLKRRFTLDDEYIEDLKADLIDAKRLAVDEDGKVLVWVGKGEEAKKGKGENESRVPSLESEGQGRASTVQTPDPRRQTLDSAAERRQLTVMFCDLVGSTALSAQLDPEELREVVRGYQEMGAVVIERFGGHIAQYLGDGLLVYFGYPVAHEDDAQRAVRAGLEIVEAIRGRGPGIEGQDGSQSLSTRLLHPLQVRIGIHTGPVVVGEIGGGAKRELLALGETPNLAARIQGQAAPNEVLMSAATYRLVEGLFECEDRGQPELKGVSTPLTLYRVVKEGEVQSRFEVVARRGLTPLVGRDHEFGLLRERWTQAKSGEGQVVLLSGEPGIGKSRLVEALKESVAHEGARCLELRCSPYHQNSALYPIIEHLQRMLGFQGGESPEEKLQRLVVGAHSCAPLQKDIIPLLAALLSLPHPPDFPALTLSPQKQKEKTHEALVAWLCEDAKQQAVTYAWEDLHWADPSTLEVLMLLLDQVPTTRLLALLTFRPEFVTPWGNRSHLSQMTLSRLGRTHVEEMVKNVTDGRALPSEVLQQIVIKTDGVPLFVEELTKTVVESNLLKETENHYELTGPLTPLAIPSTLQDSLMARLDRLATAKEIAQLGATIGREFSYEILQVVSPLDEETLQHGLKQLVEVDLLYQRGLPPQATYLFKHALIQDTAYQSLLKSTRQKYHNQIAQILEARFPETVETQPELVAYHYTEAGLVAQAIPYWQRAGERATQRSAYVEAVSHLTRGLEVLKALPDNAERSQQELNLQLALSAALLPVKGYGSPDVEKTYNRARELCQQLGETPQLFPVLNSLETIYMVRGEFQIARELAEQLMRLAQSVQDRFLLSVAHNALGQTLYFLGELTSARTHLEQAMALYDPQMPLRSTIGAYDPRVMCRSYAALTLWCLGYPDQALKRSQEAVALAAGQSRPFGLAASLGFAAWFHEFRREEQATQKQAEASIALSTEHGFPVYLAVGTFRRGWALTEQGQVEEGIMQLRQGLAAYRATGAQMGQSNLLALLAEAYGKAGQVEEGLRVLAEGLALVDKTGERFVEAKLYRLKGKLSLQSGVRGPESEVQKGAEECFLKAIKIAQRQQAKSLELRAATSLARLWQQQGKQKEAHGLLSEIYNWFTEGFDTKDLQEAKALLESLGSSV